ncbi:glycosyltransferase family 4 protein, partial [Candidatus Sumerlaeota bacterium]|nr:glycosyltransferase family 4 protein [Candidatus Sumerlaeota bacterium]
IEDQQEWMALQGPHSSGLLAFLAANRADYDGFVLFTYLYATSYDTLEHVRGKFYLVPFAHDEPPIYLRLFEDVFRAARGIVFCTEEERNFVQQRFPFALPRGEVLGMGVDLPAGADGERFRSRFDMREPFMLYAGRIAESKSCRDLFGCYSAYRAHAGSSDQTLSLALCGSAQMRVPRLRGIRYLGVISEQEKWDAMAAARFLVLPSRFESLSIVLLEAWATGTPALVNGTCLVSVGQCRRSQAGLWYRNADEFSLVADWLARDDGLCRRLGANGLDFVRSSYQWPKIVERYMEFIRFEALAIV